MPVILAVEPDRKQAARLAAIVRHHVGAELVLADTTERALDALGARVPDMVLVPALLSPQDDASLAAALRVIAAAAHVRTLTIPVLASTSQEESRGGFLSRWRRGKAESPALDGCDPAVFAEQITAYLKEAAAERLDMEDMPARTAPFAQPAAAETETTPATETLFDTESIFDTQTITAETSYEERFADERFVQPSPAHETFASNAFLTETFSEQMLVPETPSQTAAVETSAAEETALFEDTPLVEEKPLFDETALVEETTLVEAMHADAPVEETCATHAFVARTYGDETPSEETIDEEPSIDLSDELVTLSVDGAEENLFDGEPFGTYTLPSVEELGPEAALLEAAAALDAPVWVEPPITLEQPVAFEPSAEADAPIAAHSEFEFERPVAWEPPVACEPPVVFDSAAIFGAATNVDTAPGFEPPAIVAPAPAIETRATIEPRVAVEPPAVAERPTLREPAAAMLTSWRAWPPLEGVPIEVPGIAAAKAEVPDWSSLMASLREDMERRRGHEHPPQTLKQKPRAKTAKPTVDEWGFFDPEQCGFSALLAKLDEITSA